MKIYLTKSWESITTSENLQNRVKMLSDGRYILEIKKIRQWRSLGQNAWLHTVCEYLEINSWIGYTAEEWKDFFKWVLLVEKKRQPTDRRRKYTRIRWTSELDTKEFTDFMEKILIFCETELKIPRSELLPPYQE